MAFHPSPNPPHASSGLPQWAALGSLASSISTRLAEMRQRQFARRFWEKDPTLWKEGPEASRAIRERLGWLSVIEPMQENCRAVIAFAQRVRRAGFTHAVLLGMGGSSLGAEVCRRSFGVAPSFLDLAVLDSTDPAVIRRVERRGALEKTLFLVSTKSGTTAETLCFFGYFYDRVRKRQGERAGENFVAITDPGTPLVTLAAEKRFRHTFLNPSDIGGRFSVLSYFGLVPAALLGVDIRQLLQRASHFLPSQAPEMETEDNPAVQLGVILGELGLQGRDKVTFLASPPIASFGTWVEQLLAESTGKEGKGLFPVHGEPPANPEVYGPDRVFVHLHLRSSPDRQITSKLAALEKAGHPVIRLELKDTLDLGAEFFRWEIATAVAGFLFRIDPFDQPNVQETKSNTDRLLRKFEREGKLAESEPLLQQSGLRVYGGTRTKALLKRLPVQGKARAAGIEDLLSAHFRPAKAGGYVALLAYLAPSPQREKWLQQLRVRLRNALRTATSLGYGPRYLHSTGQFHKGGPPNGLFLEITAQEETDLAIPGLPYTFGMLERAQALGDWEALQSRKRPVLRLDLGKNPDAGLRRLAQWAERALLPLVPTRKKPSGR